MNKIIILTGVSGSGKTTLAKELGKEFSLPVVYVSDIIREYASNNNFSSLSHYFTSLGIEEGFRQVRDKIIKIYLELEKNNVILDGLYDYEIFKELKSKLNNRVFVISFSAPKTFRLKQYALRKGISVERAKKEIGKRDLVKWKGGLRTILSYSSAKFRNRGNNREELFSIFGKFGLRRQIKRKR